MRSLHRYPDQTALDVRGGQRRPEAHGRPSPLAGSGRGDEGLGPQVVETPPTLERWDLVESRWGLGSVVVLLAGAALAVLGVVAAGRTGIDDTWYQPVAAVAGFRLTPPVAGVWGGVGGLFVGARPPGGPGA